MALPISHLNSHAVRRVTRLTNIAPVADSVEVAIVGAGQAGLATSYHLKQAGVEHVVLESGRGARASRRWDTFCLGTPNWTVQLPGGAYRGTDPDGYMNREEIVDHFEHWADSFQAPIEKDCTVFAVDPQDGGGFTLRIPTGTMSARSVVVATGGY